MRRDAGERAGPAGRWIRAGWLAVGLVSLGYVALYLGVAFSRAGLSYELEWIEGSMVDAVQRVLDGEPLYTAPTLEFAPFIYPPLYFLASAALGALVGPGFLALRLVSIASSLVCIALCHRFVWRETGDRLAGLFAAGLFAACFEIGGAWFDLARVDSLCLALLLASFYLLRFAERARGAVAGGLLLAAAISTKQTAALSAAPLALYALLARGRFGWWYAGSAGVAALAMSGAFQIASQGWYGFYVFEIPGAGAPRFEKWPRFWLDDLLRPLPIASALALVSLALGTGGGRAPRRFYLWMGLGILASAFLSRLHVGGYRNVAIPAYAWIAISCGLWVARVRAPGAAAGSARDTALQLGTCALVLVQLGLRVYDPRVHLPSDAQRAADQQLVARLRAVDGEVWIPSHGWLAARAGKRPSANQMSILDLYMAKSELWQELEAERARALREGRYAAIVTDHPDPQIERSGRYAPPEPLFPPGFEVRPLTGVPTGPRFLYARRR